MQRLMVELCVDLELRLMKPRALFTFAHCSVTCLDHVRLSVTHTPRSPSDLQVSSGNLSNTYNVAVLNRVAFAGYLHGLALFAVECHTCRFRP